MPLQNPGINVPGFSDNRTVLRFSPDLPDGAYIPGGSVFNPHGDWQAWEWHEEAVPEWDPEAEPPGFASPEFNVIFGPDDDPWRDPPRIYEGEGALKAHTFFRRHRAGWLQQVTGVEVGSRLRFDGWAHCWSQSGGDAEATGDDPKYSTGVGTGAFFSLLADLDPDDQAFEGQRNMTVMVGIDPTGGTNPFSDSVEWGDAACIYNVYARVPAVEAVAESSTVTVFTFCTVRWRFKHCDEYWDGFELVIEGPTDPPVDPPEPSSWPYAGEAVDSDSRLTSHNIEQPAGDDLLGHWMAQEPPYVVPYFEVVVASPAGMQSVVNLHAISPDTRFIVRLLEVPGIDVQSPNFSGDPQAYMDGLLPIMRQYRDVVFYWCLWNECDPVGEDGWVEMADFAVECMRIAGAEGFRIALLSNSPGVPEDSEWDAIIDRTQFFQVAREFMAALSYHSYAQTSDPGSIEFILLRYDYLFDRLADLDLVLPLLFTEFSVERAVIQALDPDELLAEYLAQDVLCSSRYWVFALCVYTFGMSSGSWEDYDHNPIWREFADLVLAQRGRENARPPEGTDPPIEPPEGCDCDPREPYANVTMLIPPGHGFEYIEALRDPWEVHRFNITGSADDAGHKPRCSSVDVVALNPGAWPGGLAAFFAEWYPIVNLTEVVAETPEEWRDAVWAFYGQDPPVDPPVDPPSGSAVGIHSAPKPYPTTDVETTVSRLRDLEIGLYKTIDEGPVPGAGGQTNDTVYARLRDEGIPVIVRMFQQGQFPDRLAWPLMERARYIHDTFGVQIFEFGNEPNLAGEWAAGQFPATGWRDASVVAQVANNIMADMNECIDWGGFPLFPAMGPTDNNGNVNTLYSSVMWARNIVDYIARAHPITLRSWLQEGMAGLAVHAIRMNRPLGFDPLQFGTAIDDMCMRGFEWLQDHFEMYTSVRPVTYSTEGGVFSPYHMRQLGWEPDYDDATWGVRVWEMYEWMQAQGRLAGVTSWFLTDEGVGPDFTGGGWYGPGGEARSPVTVRLG